MTSINFRTCKWTMLEFRFMCKSIELVINFVMCHHGILGCCWCESCGQVGGLYLRCFTFPFDRRHMLRCFFFLYYAFASNVTEISRISVVMYVSDQFVYGKLHLTSGPR